MGLGFMVVGFRVEAKSKCSILRCLVSETIALTSDGCLGFVSCAEGSLSS